MRRTTSALVVAGLLFAAPLRAQHIGWYDNSAGNPGNRAAEIARHGTYNDRTLTVQYWEPADWAAAEAANLKVWLLIPDEMYWAIGDDGSVPMYLETPMWCRTESWCNKTFADFFTLVREHAAQLAGIKIGDETDCNTSLVRWPNWTYDSCRRAALKLAALNAFIKANVPGVRTWANYTSLWAYYYLLALQNNRHPSTYGVSLAPSDIVSLDCYTQWTRCIGSASVQTLYVEWKKYMNVTQTLALLPRAFLGNKYGWNPTEGELATHAAQYEAYARAEPRVELISPFLYRDVPAEGIVGAKSTVTVENVYIAMGMRLTGRAGPPPPAAPQNVRIVREVME